MKLYFLKEDELNSLKDNVKYNFRKYSDPTNEWIPEFFDGQSPFVEYKFEVNDFALDMSEEKPNNTDINNAKILYANLMDLTETQAIDERFWAGLTHGVFWEFMRYRWSYHSQTPAARNIDTRYFFGYGPGRKSLFRNTLSKLWWTGKMVYDKNRKDPFELIEVLKRDFTTRVNDLFSSNYSSNPVISRAFLSAIQSFEKNDTLINGTIYREATKYLNVLGGTYILDYFTEEELADKIIKRVEQLLDPQ